MFQDVIDGLVVLAMFFLRIGVPIVITLGIGIWLEKKLQPRQTQRTARRGTIIPFPRVRQGANASAIPLVPCWDAKQCDPTARAQCAATKRPDLPCWLALQTAGGKVRAECADCELYTHSQRVVA
ncbi:MAG: hypothetical protein L0Y55_06730 [Anaerolineales bacterium]|nr:hypothetical protein [Anaerolineales bacterium]